jgi:hypothetical protein
MYLTTITPIYTIVSVLFSLVNIGCAYWLHDRRTLNEMIDYLLSSRLCIFIHVNTCYVLLFIVGRTIMAFFIGKIRKREFKLFQMNMVEYSRNNLVLVFHILQLNKYETALWIMWFTIVGFFKVHTIIARERANYYMSWQVLENEQTKHRRLFGLLLTIVICDLALILFSIKCLGFSQIGTLFFMIYECWIILVEVSQSVLNYKMFLDQHYNIKSWEDREEISCLVDFIFEVIRLCSVIVHYFHIWMIGGCSLSLIDLALFILIHSAFNKLRKNITKFIRYQEFSNSYSHVLEEELKEHDECIICYSNMTCTTAKKLPCGHIFHIACVKKWMQRTSSCPICRKAMTRTDRSDSSQKINNDQS